MGFLTSTERWVPEKLHHWPEPWQPWEKSKWNLQEFIDSKAHLLLCMKPTAAWWAWGNRKQSECLSVERYAAIQKMRARVCILMCNCLQDLLFSIKSRYRTVLMVGYHLYKIRREQRRKNTNTVAYVL